MRFRHPILDNPEVQANFEQLEDLLPDFPVSAAAAYSFQGVLSANVAANGTVVNEIPLKAGGAKENLQELQVFQPTSTGLIELPQLVLPLFSIAVTNGQGTQFLWSFLRATAGVATLSIQNGPAGGLGAGSLIDVQAIVIPVGPS